MLLTYSEMVQGKKSFCAVFASFLKLFQNKIIFMMKKMNKKWFLLLGSLLYTRKAKTIEMKSAEQRGRQSGDMVTSMGSAAKWTALCTSVIALPAPARRP